MLNIVLFEPEIAENTGNIIRTCVAFNATLHMIRPYGFFFSKNNSQIHRSSVGYIEHLKLHEYDCFDDFIKTIKHEDQLAFITRYANQTTKQIDFQTNKNLYLIFGKESTGIPLDILNKYKNQAYRIPMTKNTRALNLANCVAMMSYQYVSSHDFENLELLDFYKKSL